MARSRGTDLLGKAEKIIGPGARIEWDDRQLSLEIVKAMDSKLKRAAQLVARLARKEAPKSDPQSKRQGTQFASWKKRKPGSLRKSIRVKKSRFKGGGWLVYVGGRDTFYWYFVHYGTYKTYPNWFMTRALHKAKAQLRGRF